MRHRKPTPQVLELIERTRAAFADVVLGNGIGLHQAEAMDDYATKFTLSKLRPGEETRDWSRLRVEELNETLTADLMLGMSISYTFSLTEKSDNKKNGDEKDSDTESEAEVSSDNSSAPLGAKAGQHHSKSVH